MVSGQLGMTIVLLCMLDVSDLVSCLLHSRPSHAIYSPDDDKREPA